ncbi:MAG: hypothetical protein AB1374_04905 [Bacillota bacterium]
MFQKTCPNCNQPSYSASDRRKWLCPHCGTDLTAVPAKVAGQEGREEITDKLPLCPYKSCRFNALGKGRRPGREAPLKEKRAASARCLLSLGTSRNVPCPEYQPSAHTSRFPAWWKGE